MRKLFLLFLPTLLMLTAFFPTACSDDNDESVPEEVKSSIQGNYNGTCGAVCMPNYRDTLRINSNATVDATSITIESLPVASLIDSILGKGIAEANGIKSAPLRMGYALYNAKQAYYPMSYDPSPIMLNVEKDGTTHEIDIRFAGKGSDFIWYYPKRLRIDITVATSRVFLDGEDTKLTFRFPIVLNRK